MVFYTFRHEAEIKCATPVVLLQFALMNRIQPQWRLLRGGRLIILSGMEWHQTPGNHVFDVFDTITLQQLLLARPPQLRCHQHPANPGKAPGNKWLERIGNVAL